MTKPKRARVQQQHQHARSNPNTGHGIGKKHRKMSSFAKLSTKSSHSNSSTGGNKENKAPAGKNEKHQQKQHRRPIVPFQRTDRILLVGEGGLSLSTLHFSLLFARNGVRMLLPYVLSTRRLRTYLPARYRDYIYIHIYLLMHAHQLSGNLLTRALLYRYCFLDRITHMHPCPNKEYALMTRRLTFLKSKQETSLSPIP